MIKFISLLGTGSYVPCNYYINKAEIRDCCYVQEAIVKILETEGSLPDSTIVFTTEEAYKKNWLNCAYYSNGEDLKEKSKKGGLQEILKKAITGGSSKNVMIPSGDKEEDLWILFMKILDEIEENDEIILDITHSFRYLPMLVFIIVNYARSIKNCSLKYIFYGAFEALGNINQVKSKPIEDRNVPIYDLTPFANLFDWTVGIDRYLATGDISIVKELTNLEIKKINSLIGSDPSLPKDIEKSILYKNSKKLKELSKSMEKYSEVVFTCRGQIIPGKLRTFKKNIDTVIESTAYQDIKPLAPVIQKLKDQFQKFEVKPVYFNDSNLIEYIETAKWCLNNKMYQQGLTILHEGLISFICDKRGVDKLVHKNRKSVTFDSRNLSKKYKYGKEEDISNSDKLFLLIHDMGDFRNDINHAGWNKEPAAYDRFGIRLKEFIEDTERLIKDFEIEDENNTCKNMLLIFSHELTNNQIKEAEQKYDIVNFLSLEKELLGIWSNIPPELEDVNNHIEKIIKWIDTNGQLGDYALVQGDFGATVKVVNHCKKRGITPIYATTKRIVKKDKAGEKIVLSREFEHVIFREY